MNGFTPLYWAAFDGNTEMVELLLAAGAAVDAKANDGKTPLYVAVDKDFSDVAYILAPPRRGRECRVRREVDTSASRRASREQSPRRFASRAGGRSARAGRRFSNTAPGGRVARPHGDRLSVDVARPGGGGREAIRVDEAARSGEQRATLRRSNVCWRRGCASIRSIRFRERRSTTPRREDTQTRSALFSPAGRTRTSPITPADRRRSTSPLRAATRRSSIFSSRAARRSKRPRESGRRRSTRRSAWAVSISSKPFSLAARIRTRATRAAHPFSIAPSRDNTWTSPPRSCRRARSSISFRPRR